MRVHRLRGATLARGEGGKQPRDTEWFLQKRYRAALPRKLPCVVVPAHDDQRHINGPRREFPNQASPVKGWHQQVDDEHCGSNPLDGGERFVALAGQLDGITTPGERCGERGAGQGVVVNDEDWAIRHTKPRFQGQRDARCVARVGAYRISACAQYVGTTDDRQVVWCRGWVNVDASVASSRVWRSASARPAC